MSHRFVAASRARLGRHRLGSLGGRTCERPIAAVGERYCVALCAADGPAAEAVVEEALGAGVAPTTIQVGVIMAAMKRIGELWEQGEMTVADEHAATGLSYRALLPLQEPLQIAPRATLQ